MGISPLLKRIIWIAWLLIVPFGIWMTYKMYPPFIPGASTDIFAFLILMFVVASMPMVVNNTPIFLIQWVSMAVFLTFGLFIEMILIQLALLVLLLRLRIPKSNSYRFPLNSLMFFIVSLFSGFIFYFFGGTHGENFMEHPYGFWLGALYGISNYAINQVILILLQVFLFKLKGPYFGKDFIWESVTTIITFPIGFVLYVLYPEMSILSLLFVGIPFASLSIILSLYYSSDKVNEFLQSAAEIGHQLAERLHVNEVIDLFVQKLIEILPVDYAYIFDITENDTLKLIQRVEHGEKKPSVDLPIKKGEGISGLVWEKKKPLVYNGRKEWNAICSGYLPEAAESVMSVPIMRNNHVTGILVLASCKKRSFEKSQLMIVDILCSHFAIAVENAKHYEKTKEFSERCGLTGLYNYRYFENLLSSEFSKLQTGERNLLSLILLDIDHFKKVNDTYGHQSGNEILCELAGRLNEFVGNRGTVARYGGEEFVVLLPETEKHTALQFAEQIRILISGKPFTLLQAMEEDEKGLKVDITASIGVATAPQDADDFLALIRHADRALYVGAKRNGRNRVAEYQK